MSLSPERIGIEAEISKCIRNWRRFHAGHRLRSENGAIVPETIETDEGPTIQHKFVPYGEMEGPEHIRKLFLGKDGHGNG